MSRFGNRDVRPTREPGDDSNSGERDWTCHRCDTHLKGSWHHCPTCCATFAALAGFDKHRIGGTAGRRERCLTGDEMTADNWTRDDNHVWRVPDKTEEEDSK